MNGQAQPLPANTLLDVTLEAQQWNAVLAAISETPFKTAAPLIQAISEQLQTASGQVSPNGRGTVERRSGGDHDTIQSGRGEHRPEPSH